MYDPISDESFGAERCESIEGAVNGASCIVIGADHEVFKKLDVKLISKKASPGVTIYDGRLVLDREYVEKHGISYTSPAYLTIH